MYYKKILTSVLVATCLVAAPANANVGAGMQSWFDSMGGFTNTTPPSSYKGQTMNGYSGGGFYQRAPVKNYQLAQMTPPSLNIGCGGIDLTAGSFSFINRAQLTAMFQNIGTSLSYAFLLAIKASMPSMESMFEYLQDVANKINAMNINSCKMAEGIAPLLGSDVSKSASDAWDHVSGSITNAAPDSFTSWSAKQADKKASRDQAMALDPSKKEQYLPGNVMWRALSKTTGLDDQDKMFIMSMTGTIIIYPPDPAKNVANDGTAASWYYIEPTGLNVNDFIGNTGVGPTQPLNMFVCDTFTDCQNPTVSVLPTTNTFYSLVSAKLDNLKNNLLGRSPQTLSDFYLVDAASIPVWKMISTSAHVNPGFIDAYKRLIAVDVAFAYVQGILKTAGHVIANSQNGSTPADAKEALRKLAERLDVLRTELSSQRLAEYAKVQQQAELERQLQLMHQTLTAGLPAQSFNSMTVFGSGH